mmetsp:Transcript_37270/g.73816  ORF Transcript_37270/g.73816 Transcript_37270/m.73816 type:complete len:353 (+) Transcript_37270:90-1148(+)
MKDTPFHFSGVAAEKVGICQQGYLSPPFGSPSYLKPSFVGIGWTLANDNGKVGWVYDLATAGKYSPIETARRVLTNLRRSKTHVADHSHQKEAALDARRARSPLTQNAISNTEEGVDDINVILRRMVVKRKRSSVPSHLNKIPLLIKNMTLPGILSFPLRFNSSSPGLILEHLKSYEGYGDAVIWVTRSDDAVEIEGATRRSPTLKETAEAALAVAWENSKFATKCRHEHSQEKRGSPRRVHRSADCSLINSGSWDDPAIVEGQWEDRSSQIVSEIRYGGLLLDQDAGVPGNAWRAVLSPTADFFLPPPPRERWMNQKVKGSGVVDGCLHVMMVPWSEKKGTRFKVSGVLSC